MLRRLLPFLLIPTLAILFAHTHYFAVIDNANNNNKNNKNNQPLDDYTLPVLNHDRLVFAHVGKTGGQTLKLVLKIGCKSIINKMRKRKCFTNLPSSRLSESVVAYYHCFEMIPRSFKFDSGVANSSIINNNNNSKNDYTKTTFSNHNLHNNNNNNITAVLFTLRHPLARTLSWYRYVHPAHCFDRWTSPSCRARQFLRNLKDGGWTKRFYKDCFPTFGDLLSVLSLTQKENTHNNADDNAFIEHGSNSSCTRLAYATLHGHLHPNITLAAHMVANIQHYIQRTLVYSNNDNNEETYHYDNISNNYTNIHDRNSVLDSLENNDKTTTKIRSPDVLVIRTENLWSDLRKIDRDYLKGTGDFGKFNGYAVTHGSEYYKNTTRKTTDMLSKKVINDNVNNNTFAAFIAHESIQMYSHTDRKSLCCALRDEMLAYRFLIFQAVNLPIHEKQSTWRRALNMCSVDDDNNSANTKLDWQALCTES